jgi:hypothetical protein
MSARLPFTIKLFTYLFTIEHMNLTNCHHLQVPLIASSVFLIGATVMEVFIWRNISI